MARSIRLAGEVVSTLPGLRHAALVVVCRTSASGDFPNTADSQLGLAALNNQAATSAGLRCHPLADTEGKVVARIIVSSVYTHLKGGECQSTCSANRSRKPPSEWLAFVELGMLQRASVSLKSLIALVIGMIGMVVMRCRSSRTSRDEADQYQWWRFHQQRFNFPLFDPA